MDALLAELERLKLENQRLKEQLADATPRETSQQLPNGREEPSTRLSTDQIRRFSRQLLLPEIGMKGQLALANAKVLVVGAGGLGSPAALYLAAAGIGTLGIVEHDTIDVSNLHRQVIHTEDRIGTSKVESARQTIRSLNSTCRCSTYDLVIDSTNALDIVKDYDILLDASDNVATRYLLNDACILLGKPLVSGSALRFDGQLSVYERGKGPCYRCIFPKPPPPETVTNCSDGGVVGPVTGVIGCLQALEAIKIITGMDSSFQGKMLLFDGVEGTFRTVKLRPRRTECAVCGDNPTIAQLQDYVAFCGRAATDKDETLDLLPPELRVSSRHYAEIRAQGLGHVLIDTRDRVQLDICGFEGALNIPFAELETRLDEVVAAAESSDQGHQPVYVICRRGNDSQRAVEMLRNRGLDKVFDIRDGYVGWAEFDPTFPVY